ncbi:FAD-dependent oxidoreductase, partial [Frankia sp. CcWB2]
MGTPSAPLRWTTRCAIAGGGPAGMMLGLLLARAGVDVIVLEKHADFARDFRGDTIHPSTMAVMAELGLLTDFLRLPHTRAATLALDMAGRRRTVVDFRHLRTPCPFIALMPQWDFLTFLAERTASYPTFRLAMSTEATDLVRANGRVVGVRAAGPLGEVEIRADLTVAADGRRSTLRSRAGLPVREHGAPFDVLWFRLPKDMGDGSASGRRAARDGNGNEEGNGHGEEKGNERGEEGNGDGFTLAHLRKGHALITLDRRDYWQCGMVVRKGSAQRQPKTAGGLAAFRARIIAAAPALSSAVDDLTDWDQVKTLVVQVDRLRRWFQPGLLCIGDAAHAMSPAGGVGVNYAVQDAVATANLMAATLRAGPPEPAELRRVQRRRTWPVVLMQMIQVRQGAFLVRLLGDDERPAHGGSPSRRVTRAPMTNAVANATARTVTGAVRAGMSNLVTAMMSHGVTATAAPRIRRVLGRVIGIGFRPEHVRTPDVFAKNTGYAKN